jgi:hypothetical protein
MIRSGQRRSIIFQAQKFAGSEHEEAIRQAETPFQAAQMGRDRSRPLLSDWEQVKLKIMRQAVEAKFQQHPELRGLLVSTGDCLLIENTRNDRFWGDNGDGSGANWLGKILMETREKLSGSEEALFILPPWVAFPEEDPTSSFWRMGKGESYLDEYWQWKEKLTDLAKEQYDAYFIPPLGWEEREV